MGCAPPRHPMPPSCHPPSIARRHRRPSRLTGRLWVEESGRRRREVAGEPEWVSVGRSTAMARSCQGLVGAPSPTSKIVRESERACPQHGHFTGKATVRGPANLGAWLVRYHCTGTPLPVTVEQSVVRAEQVSSDPEVWPVSASRDSELILPLRIE